MPLSIEFLDRIANTAAELEPLLPRAGRTSAPRALVFQPEAFFLGRTEGAGVVRDPFGRVVRRCRITTVGSLDAAHGVIRLEEMFTYEDGEVDTWRWAMSPSRDGRYVAAEIKAGAGIAGERHGADYVLSFRRPYGPARGLLAPRFETRFTMLSQEIVLKRARVHLFGLPLGELTAVHRRAG
ncbi:MAG TPA: DUF3833 family protein [Caulobacteraceae bacterium]|nr:DUF3833 family protein [Caulobacteraceae bacterium]